jgi:hypothetical protein
MILPRNPLEAAKFSSLKLNIAIFFKRGINVFSDVLSGEDLRRNIKGNTTALHSNEHMVCGTK